MVAGSISEVRPTPALVKSNTELEPLAGFITMVARDMRFSGQHCVRVLQ
jgi:hypothetical protein